MGCVWPSSRHSCLSDLECNFVSEFSIIAACSKLCCWRRYCPNWSRCVGCLVHRRSVASHNTSAMVCTAGRTTGRFKIAPNEISARQSEMADRPTVRFPECCVFPANQRPRRYLPTSYTEFCFSFVILLSYYCC